MIDTTAQSTQLVWMDKIVQQLGVGNHKSDRVYQAAVKIVSGFVLFSVLVSTFVTVRR
jgi:hypothetical protein